MPIIHASSASSSTSPDRSFAPICLSVIFIHCLLILWAALSATKAPTKIPPAQKRLVVQTIPLNAPPQNAQPLAANAKTLSPKKKTLPTPPASAPAPILEEPAVLPESELLVEKEPVSKKQEVPAKPAPKKAPAPEPAPEPEQEPEPTPEPIPEKAAKATLSPVKKEEKKAPNAKKPVKDKAKTPSKKKETPKGEGKSAPKTPAKPAAKPNADKKPAVVDTKKKAEEAKALAEKNKKIEQEKAAKLQQQKLLSQAQERIAKISQTRDKLSAGKISHLGDVVALGEITSLHVDALVSSGGGQLGPREMSYRDELAGRMKLLLKLPEYGEVKIKLVLARNGKVLKVTVVSAESQANRKHIEKTLPTLSFPAFGTNFGDAQEYTFSITLSNEL